MSATSFALAMALLTSPPGAAVPPVPAEEWPALRDAILAQAQESELLDPREERLLRLEKLTVDLNVLRTRRRELAAAPHLGDAHWLPSPRIAEEMLAFNRAYRRTLSNRQALDYDRAGDLTAALAETDRLYEVWDAVRDAGCEVYYAPVRRAALQRLQGLIGEPAFLAGRLPPHVPVWRFIEIR